MTPNTTNLGKKRSKIAVCCEDQRNGCPLAIPLTVPEQFLRHHPPAIHPALRFPPPPKRSPPAVLGIRPRGSSGKATGLRGLGVSEAFSESEIRRRGYWKRGICIELSEIDFQIRDRFATSLRTLSLMYKTKYRQFCANLARNLRNAPLPNAPFSGFLTERASERALGTSKKISGMENSQEAAQYLPKGCSKKMPPSFPSFQWVRLLEHSFLEHFCLDQFSVLRGKLYTQDPRTPRLVEHFWVPILGASCSNKHFVGTLRPSQIAMNAPLRGLLATCEGCCWNISSLSMPKLLQKFRKKVPPKHTILSMIFVL